MIAIHFKRNSAAIDDDDLRAIGPIIKVHMTEGTPEQKDYALLLAKMMFRISELRAAAQPGTMTAQELVDRVRAGEQWKLAETEQPFAYFQWNQGWSHWEEVIASAAGQEGVVAAYRSPVACSCQMAGAQNVVESAETRANAGIEVVPEKTVQVPLESNVQKVNIAPTTAKFAAVPTDERIKEIWESFGYRTRFAPHMLRLVRAVLVLIDVAPLQVQDERIAHLERLLSRAKNHIVDWWRPEGSLPPAKSPDLVEDIEAALNPAKGAAQ